MKIELRIFIVIIFLSFIYNSFAQDSKEESLVKEGEFYLSQWAHMGAFGAFNEAIKINPRYAKAYLMRGEAYRDIGKIDESIYDYSKAIEIDPRYVEAYLLRGTAYRKRGENKKAISDYS